MNSDIRSILLVLVAFSFRGYPDAVPLFLFNYLFTDEPFIELLNEVALAAVFGI